MALRIILVGQANFAEKVLDTLVKKGEEVVAVFCPPDAPGGRIDPLKQLAFGLAIPVYQHKSLKTPEVRAEFAELKADLAILAFVTQIVPLEVINTPRFGSICFHPSLLPKYRGGSAINWTLIKGETKTGVTIFWPDAGIDTGPILLQKGAEISPDDTTGTLYFNKLFSLGVEAIDEAVDLIKAGKAPRIPQNESQATYDPLCRDEHAGITWSRPVQQVYNLIRGCDPQPGAYTSWQGKRLRVYDCRLHPGQQGKTPGEVVGVESEGFVVAAQGRGIVVKRVRPEGSDKKISAAEFAATAGVKPGSQLG
jgi:methionyl-tRNA formyltransferase